MAAYHNYFPMVDVKVEYFSVVDERVLRAVGKHERGCCGVATVAECQQLRSEG